MHVQNKLWKKVYPAKDEEWWGSSLWNGRNFQGDLRWISTPYSTVCARVSERNTGKIQGHTRTKISHCDKRSLKLGSKLAPIFQLNSTAWCVLGRKYLVYPLPFSLDIKTVDCFAAYILFYEWYTRQVIIMTLIIPVKEVKVQRWKWFFEVAELSQDLSWWVFCFYNANLCPPSIETPKSILTDY